jgi:hypothetical protein
MVFTSYLREGTEMVCLISPRRNEGLSHISAKERRSVSYLREGTEMVFVSYLREGTEMVFVSYLREGTEMYFTSYLRDILNNFVNFLDK